MSKALRWFAASVGYLLYTALVLVLLLWFLLPPESIRLWLQAQMNAASPGLRWEIKELHAALQSYYSQSSTDNPRNSNSGRPPKT